MKKQGMLMIISGPSGTGKGTVVKELVEKQQQFALSVSATTRSPRHNEIDGVHYYFYTRETHVHNIFGASRVSEFCSYVCVRRIRK